MRNTLLAALTAIALSSTSMAAMAATPADQLVVGLSMSNILTLDPAAIAGRESTAVITNI